MFFRPGNVVVVVSITFLTAWSLVILTLKLIKLRLQRQALQLAVIPEDADFHLSPHTVGRVDDRISYLVDDARAFLLIHRISLGLSNLKNMGRVGDVAEIFKTQADYDEASVETSYLLVSVFVWAIPVLGFIGTVLGLSSAIGNFGGVLQSSKEIESIKDNLQSVTGGLATAFETTLIGLVAALLVQLLVVWCKQSELEFLDQCSDYCSRNVVSRLRLLPLEEAT
jgi:biopolymer transport protein ExbB/TolQ